MVAGELILKFLHDRFSGSKGTEELTAHVVVEADHLPAVGRQQPDAFGAYQASRTRHHRFFGVDHKDSSIQYASWPEILTRLRAVLVQAQTTANREIPLKEGSKMPVGHPFAHLARNAGAIRQV